MVQCYDNVLADLNVATRIWPGMVIFIMILQKILIIRNVIHIVICTPPYGRLRPEYFIPKGFG